MGTSFRDYLRLLQRNPRFRRLWYGQVVSQLGDWFASIALYTLILDMTGSAQALGLLLVAEFLPPTLVALFAGVILDRVSRKWAMVWSDGLRALLTPALLYAYLSGNLTLVYIVVALRFALISLFEPARSAVLPLLVERRELVLANAISGATWSVMLAVGAALGGFVAGTFGIEVALILDALTFVVSGWLIAGIPIDEPHRQPGAAAPPFAPLREFGEGLRYIFSRGDIACYALAKAGWNLGGGVLLLLTLYGRELFPIGVGGAISIGLLYMARGIGTGIGPPLLLRLRGDDPTLLRRWVGLSCFLSLAGYALFSGAPTLGVALIAAVLAHIGGSINWVFSSTLLQQRVPDRLRGRVFTVEFAALTFTQALSSYLAGAASDAGATPRLLALLLAGLFVVPGVVLTALLWRTPPAAPDPDDP